MGVRAAAARCYTPGEGQFVVPRFLKIRMMKIDTSQRDAHATLGVF